MDTIEPQMLDDKQFDVIIERVMCHEATQGDAVALVAFAKWLMNQWNEEGDAIRAFMDESNVDHLVTENSLIYRADGRGVGIIQRFDKQS